MFKPKTTNNIFPRIFKLTIRGIHITAWVLNFLLKLTENWRRDDYAGYIRKAINSNCFRYVCKESPKGKWR